MFSRILIPVDGSSNSLEAAIFSQSIIKAFGSQVVLLFVISPEMRARAVRDGNNAPTMMATEIIDIGKRVFHRKHVLVKDVILEGPPAQRICAAVVLEKCELVVMGSRGVSNIPAFLMGSVSSRVSQYARCSVLVVRNSAPVKSILVAYDGSRAACKALDVAGELAVRFRARVHLLTVARDTDAASALEEISGGQILMWHMEMAKKGIDVRMDLRTGHPAEKVVTISHETGANIVVLGGTGAGNAQATGLGSVADQVLRHCGCSVLVVK